MRKRPLMILLAVFLVIFVGTRVSSGDVDRKEKDAWYKQVELFSDALAIIQTGYVDEVKPKDLIYGALRGLLGSLDPHSQFMDPDSYNDLKVDTKGEFGGIGIEITVRDGLLTVITPLEGTPAWNAGVKAGDRIVKINNELTRDLSLMDAVKQMRGKPGEPVTITVLRESEHKLLEITIVRDIITVKDIKEARILEDGVGYIKLSEFREDTEVDLDEALDRLKAEGMQSLILDLRNNPGGLLHEAVRVAERFIDKGKIVVFTRGRQKAQNIEMVSHYDKPLLDMPMVILINEGSASGSEIVAGCLKDYKRAVIVGQKSFGKGSVQTVVPLSDGSALRLTTSKYFTPLGNVIHEKGVQPDIEVKLLSPEILEEAVVPSMIEQVFSQVEEQEAGDLDPDAIELPEAAQDEFDYTRDNQIMQAIDVLKVAQFYKKQQVETK